MIPAGHMAKGVAKSPGLPTATGVADIDPASDCVSHDVAGYFDYWRHNGHWLFDSLENIKDL